MEKNILRAKVLVRCYNYKDMPCFGGDIDEKNDLNITKQDLCEALIDLIDDDLIDGTPDKSIGGGGLPLIQKITKPGKDMVERNEENIDAISKDLQKLQNPQQNIATIINNGGNIAYQSSHTYQSISHSHEIEKILLKMIEELKRDHTLAKDKLNDAIIDVETLKMQVSKTNKDKLLIETLLKGLEKIKSIASFVKEISNFLLL